MPEQIGKVFKTDNVVNICECGESVIMKSYLFAPEDDRGAKANRILIAICKCGNTFIKNK